MTNTTSKFISIDDLLTKAVQTNLFNEAESSIAAEYLSSLLDENALKRAQDWSELANQVVGAESQI